MPVGTGPFVFDSWERDNRLVVKKNPNYWQEGVPYLDVRPEGNYEPRDGPRERS